MGSRAQSSPATLSKHRELSQSLGFHPGVGPRLASGTRLFCELKASWNRAIFVSLLLVGFSTPSVLSSCSPTIHSLPSCLSRENFAARLRLGVSRPRTTECQFPHPVPVNFWTSLLAASAFRASAATPSRALAHQHSPFLARSLSESSFRRKFGRPCGFPPRRKRGSQIFGPGDANEQRAACGALCPGPQTISSAPGGAALHSPPAAGIASEQQLEALPRTAPA